jgi:opacity protein-like surface antigen
VAAGALAGSLFLPPALADTGPWYVGASAGTAHYGVPSGDFTVVRAGQANPAGFSATSHADDSATAFRLEGGYRFNRYLALEASYADFGSANSTMTTTAPIKQYPGSIKISGEGLGAVGFLPLTDDLELFGRAGLFHFKYEMDGAVVNLNGATVLATTSVSANTTGTTGYLGAGVDYALYGGFSLRAAWDYFRAADNSLDISNPPYGMIRTREKVGVHLVSIGLLYNF